MPAVARVDDTISHGGSILSGAARTLAEGKPVARQGDAVTCSEHGMQTITGGSDAVLVAEALGPPAHGGSVSVMTHGVPTVEVVGKALHVSA